MDNPDSIVPLAGFCENCGHFAGRHQELKCHFPPEDKPGDPCRCTGMMWQNEMYDMDMSRGPQAKVAHEFIHLKGMFEPVLSQKGEIIVLENYRSSVEPNGS